MSATNWARCPRCAARRAKVATDAKNAALAAYGTVDWVEFERLRIAAARREAEVDDPGTPTFREDYEIYGAEDGEVVVSYGGSCGVCGLTLTFEDRHPLA